MQWKNLKIIEKEREVIQFTQEVCIVDYLHPKDYN